MVSPDATTRTPLSASPSRPLPTTQPSPTYVPRLRGARPRLHLPGAVARFSRGSVQRPRIICVVVQPPAARPPCRRRLFPPGTSFVATLPASSALAPSATLALLPKRPFVRSERPFVRTRPGETRPGETPPELGPAHHPFSPRPGSRERASGAPVRASVAPQPAATVAQPHRRPGTARRARELCPDSTQTFWCG